MARVPILDVLSDSWEGPPVALDGAARLTLGRGDANDICLHWDNEVSAAHALLEQVGETWTILDDGLSRNGTYLNQVRVHGRVRLVDQDRIRVGRTLMIFHDRTHVGTETMDTRSDQGVSITEAQRSVLVALCRPLVHRDALITPASNRAIASELHVSVETVRSHLKELFRRFDLWEIEPNRKRAELARSALERGLVRASDLGSID